MSTNQELKEKILELEAENKALRKGRKPNDHTGKNIPGKFTVAVESPDGEKVEKSVKFQPGFMRTRIPTGYKSAGETVFSETFMKKANGKSLTDQEIADSPALVNLSKSDCVKILTNWVEKEVGFLIPA